MLGQQLDAEAGMPPEPTPSGASPRGSLTIIAAAPTATPLVVVTHPVDDFVARHFVGSADLAGWTCVV
jgi:hypothetical protein